MQQYGPWQIRSSHEVYRDPWIAVRRDEVIRPDGADGTHVLVWMKPGVSVLALDDDGSVYLADEFHYAIGRDSVELVSGGREPGEDPLATAQRELEEELGIRARRWTALGTVDPFTSIVLSPTSLFLAQDLEFVETAPEGTEQIRCVKMTIADAVERVLDGRITHGPSCIAILRTERLIQSSCQQPA